VEPGRNRIRDSEERAAIIIIVVVVVVVVEGVSTNYYIPWGADTVA
jgi:hypothetical protein